MTLIIKLNLALNEEQEGIALACHRVELGDEALTVDNPIGSIITWVQPRSILRIGDVDLNLLYYHPCYGSKIISQIGISPEETCLLFNYLKQHGWYREGGYIELANKWRSSKLFSIDDLLDFIESYKL